MVENQSFKIHYSLDQLQKIYKRYPFLKSLQCILITGTNGKGSTATFLEMMLRSEKKKVGVFRSPSITTMNDMIQVNGTSIEDQPLQLYLAMFPSLSLFEKQVMIALLHFYAHNVDYVILEVGMGGRYDACNIVEPILSLCTNIGHDHLDYLGPTLEDVVKHKAGIARKNKVYLSTERVLQKELKKEVEVLGGIYQEVGLHEAIHHKVKYQNENCSLALAAFEALGYTLSSTALQEILRNFKWSGRFEIIQEHPRMILDGAHNVEGIKALIGSLENDCVFVFSALKDKDYKTMISLLEEYSKDLILTTFEYERAASLEELSKDMSVEVITDFREAIEKAKEKKKDVVVLGSLYFISEVRKYLKGK